MNLIKILVLFTFLFCACEDENIYKKKGVDIEDIDTEDSSSNETEDSLNNETEDSPPDAGEVCNCNQRPENYCIDDNTLAEYDFGSIGCIEEECIYSYNLVDCHWGCENNKCKDSPCTELEIKCTDDSFHCDEKGRLFQYIEGSCYHDENLVPYCEYYGKDPVDCVNKCPIPECE